MYFTTKKECAQHILAPSAVACATLFITRECASFERSEFFNLQGKVLKGLLSCKLKKRFKIFLEPLQTEDKVSYGAQLRSYFLSSGYFEFVFSIKQKEPKGLYP